MIKVTAEYAFEHYCEKVEFEFDDGTPQEDIEWEIQEDFDIWLNNRIDAGWHITSQEKD